MSHRCLADFLEELGHAGELVRVEAEVDPVEEAAEITRNIALTGGPALLFGVISGHDLPVITNLLGTETRICRALGAKSLPEVLQRMDRLVDPLQPEGWFERLKTAPHIAALDSVTPRRARSGPCQQVVRLGSDVELANLPVLQSAAEEAGPAITAAVTFSADPQSRQPIAGQYDLQVLDRDRLAVCWAAHDEPARLLAEYARRNEKMPLAVVLGGDPAVLLAAAAPLSPAADVCALAGLFREKPIDVVTCRSLELEIPAEADVVIEGYVDPAEPPATAGPLCGPLGRYTLPRPVPVMHVTARRTLAQVFLPLLRKSIPELVDHDLPPYGAGRHWAVLAIRKTHAGQARRVAHAAWGSPALTFAKMLIVVDEGTDVRDPEHVLGAIAVNVDPGRDVFFQQGPPDPFDPAAALDRLQHKMAVDATAKLPGEHTGTWPAPAVAREEIRRLVADRWAQYGLGPEPEAKQ